MRVSIIGCGSIGSTLAKAADEMPDVKRIYLMDIDKPIAEKLAASLKKAIVIDDVEEELYHCDLVVESCTQAGAKLILPKVVARGVDIMVMSVGALVDDDFRAMVFEKAKASEAKIYIPTGALSGTDGLRSASADRIDSVELITTKGPKSLGGVEYLMNKGIDVASLTDKTVVFSGPAREAVKDFPKNINVAATVSLLGIGFDKTHVTIILDPKSNTNEHILKVKGAFGEMSCTTHNVPEPSNPKTSHLASLPAISALKRIVRGEWFGI